MTIYAFGNGYLLSAILQSIVLFFQNNNIGVLFTILGTIAVFYYAIRVTISHQTSLLSTAKYFLAFFIILSTLIYNTATVTVIDESNPGWTPQQIVKVPYGIAFLWSGFTTIQYALVKDFTNDFSVPAGDNLITEGVGVSIMQQADDATISTSNSYLYQDYNQYIANCVAPGISAGYLNVSSLLGAGDATNTASPTYNSSTTAGIWSVMSAYTANTATGGGGNLLTMWYSGTSANSTTEQASGASDPGGVTETCAQVTGWLQAAIGYYIVQDAGPAIAGEMQFATFSDFTNEIGSINPYIFSLQQTAQAQLTQAIGVNMYSPAILKMAQASGASASGLAYATGMATQSTQSGLIVSGVLAGKYMPIVFGLFEAMILIASVIILILTVTHMGLKYLKLMFEILTMIAIWPALTAGFNYITQLIIQQQYGPYSGLGYSVSASGTINSFLSGSLAWMGYLSWTVPMLAYAISSGSSYAMASVIGGVQGGLRTNSATDALARGNINMGNDSLNNYNANKFDAIHTQRQGTAPKVTQEGFNTQTSAGGITDSQTQIPGIENNAHIVGSGSGNFNNEALRTKQSFNNGSLTSFQGGAINASVQKSKIATAEKNLSSAKSYAQTSSQNLTTALSNSKNLSNSVYSGLTGTQKADYNATAQKNFDYVVDHTAGLTASQINELKDSFSAGAGKGGLGFSVISSSGLTGTQKASLDVKLANITKDSFSSGGSLSFAAQGSQGRQFVSSVNDVLTTSKSFQTAESAVNTAGHNLKLAESTTANVNENAMREFFKDYDQKFGSGMDIEQLATLNNQEYSNLLNNAESLLSFVNNNKDFSKISSQITAKAKGIPGVNPQAVKADVNNFYKNNIPGYTPITGTPTAAGVKSQIQTMETPKKNLATINTGGSVKPVSYSTYLGGDAFNFLKTGLIDLNRLTHLEAPVSWSPGSYKPPAAITQGKTIIPQNSFNLRVEKFNANLSAQQQQINNSILSGSNGFKLNLQNNFTSNPIVKNGDGIIKSNEQVGNLPGGGDGIIAPPKKETPNP